MNEAMVIPALDRDDPSWQRARLEREFWEEHEQVLREKYPEQFVVVANGEVVLTNPDLLRLLAELKTQGRDRRDVWIRYMFSDPSTMML